MAETAKLPVIDTLSASQRQVLIAVNPIAGAGAQRTAAADLAADLRNRGYQVETVTDLAELARLASASQAEGSLRAVVAVGGDGTAAEIINRTPPGTPIAILPTGTENLLARYLGIGKDAAQVAEIIAAGRTAWLDAGRAGSRYFSLMASAGFDANVVDRLHATRNGNIRHSSYIKPIWQAIRSYQYPELRVWCAHDCEAGGGDSGDAGLNWGEPIRCRWAFVFNIPKYGFGLQFAPDAHAADGMFDVCTFHRGGLASGLVYLTSVVLGLHRKLPGFRSVRCRRVRIESEAPVTYEVDGDPGGPLPVELESVPRRLRALVPDSWVAPQ
jgi:diacylglycerol kinase (ATP)